MTYRQIHTKIWKDGWFLDLDATDKLLFIYLFSNERTNLAGLYDISLKVISFETEIPIEQVQLSLGGFAQKGKVFYEDGWIWIPKLLTYNAQNITSPKIQTHLQSCLSDIPDIPLKARWVEHYNNLVPPAYHIDTVSSPMHTAPYQEQEQRTDQEQEQEQEIAPADAAPPPAAPTGPPKAARKPKKPPQDPPPPAVESFRVAHLRYPAKSLWPGIVEVVGENAEDLERWGKVCLAWHAMGWNPVNVKGQIQHYVERRIPGDDHKARGSPNGVPEPAGFAAIRAVLEREGMTNE